MIEATIRKPPDPGGRPEHPRAGVYTARADRFRQAIDNEEKRYAWISHLRLVVFLAAAGAFVSGFLALENPPLAVALSGLGVLVLGGFVVLVVFHNRINERLERAKKLRWLNETA